MLCKKTSKNQITLPKKIVNEFDNVTYFEVKTEKGQIILSPVEINAPKEQKLYAIQEKIKKLRINDGDIKEAVQWARKK
jgi:hypothetical protein